MIGNSFCFSQVFLYNKPYLMLTPTEVSKNCKNSRVHHTVWTNALRTYFLNRIIRFMWQDTPNIRRPSTSLIVQNSEAFGKTEKIKLPTRWVLLSLRSLHTLFNVVIADQAEYVLLRHHIPWYFLLRLQDKRNCWKHWITVSNSTSLWYVPYQWS